MDSPRRHRICAASLVILVIPAVAVPPLLRRGDDAQRPRLEASAPLRRSDPPASAQPPQHLPTAARRPSAPPVGPPAARSIAESGPIGHDRYRAPEDGGQPLATSCRESDLPPHDGFERGGRCVAVAQGEVPDRTPAVSITRFPDRVRPGLGFDVEVQTRNLVRDRFLDADQGGYYKEMSALDRRTGVVRGHAHLYVQMLDPYRVPDADTTPPVFFTAIEDNRGGVGPDRVRVSIKGLPAGQARMCVTLGDGSHRVPMTRDAHLAVGVDCVRIAVGPVGLTETEWQWFLLAGLVGGVIIGLALRVRRPRADEGDDLSSVP